MNGLAYMADFSALQWYVEHGLSDILHDEPQDRTKAVEIEIPVMQPMARDQPRGMPEAGAPSVALLGKSEAYDEAVKLARAATSIKDLAQTIYDFDGIGIKKNAMNMVFSSGHENAKIMVIGDVPGADEDRQGTPFAGECGRLLDKILATIGLNRSAEEPEKSVYLSNVINWRPPGNRSPTEAELAVSLPFIERHIQLVAPKILVLCGGTAAQILLGRSESISRLRNSWHDYTTQCPELVQEGAVSIPTIVTYHPQYLLHTPLQKKAVWKDVLEIAQKSN